MPLRVLIGTFGLGGYAQDLAAGFRRLGHRATVALSLPSFWEGLRPGDIDVSKDLRAVSWPRLAARLREGRASAPDRFSDCRTPTQRVEWLITHHDLFVFVHASLWHDHPSHPGRAGAGREYRLLKGLGKRVVSVMSGPDVRHPSAYDQQSALLGHRATPMAELMPSWRRSPLGYRMRNLRRAEMYADAILSSPNQSGLAVRPYHHLNAPLDLSRYTFRVPGHDVPVVLHAPSDEGIKGTTRVVAALQRLQKEGVVFKLRYLENVSNRVLRRELPGADVLIDQLHFPLHGKLGLEAMATGCVLATCDRPDFEPYPARRPIWHIEPAGLEDRLRLLLTDRSLRMRLAAEGRRYVVRHHRHVDVARGILKLLRGEPYSFLHRPEFFARHYRLPRGKRVPFDLLRLTRRIVERFGLPKGVAADDLVARGLMSPVRGVTPPVWP